MEEFKQFYFELDDPTIDFSKEDFVANVEKVKNKVELYTYQPEEFVRYFLKNNEISYKISRKLTWALKMHLLD